MGFGPEFNDSGRTRISAFRDRVSDAILGRRAWRRLGADEKLLLNLERTDLQGEGPVEIGVVEVKRFELPFFNKAFLLEFRVDTEGFPAWCLSTGSYRIPMNGGGEPMYAAASPGQFVLNGETAADYLRFFCFFAQDESGPVYVVDRIDHPVLDRSRLDSHRLELLAAALRPPRLIGVTENGQYLIDATVVSGSVLSVARFMVCAGGLVLMVERDTVAAELPVVLLQPEIGCGHSPYTPLTIGTAFDQLKYLYEREPAFAALTEFADRVSDAIFGRRRWKRLDDYGVRQFWYGRRSVVEGDPVAADAYEVKRFELPFFKRTVLMEIRSGDGYGPLWFLKRDGAEYLLNGKGDPVRDAAAAAPIALTRENAVDYLRFFCFFVHADGGPAFVMDDPDHPVLDGRELTAELRSLLEKTVRAPEIVEGTEAGPYAIRAFLVRGEALLRAVFLVGADGGVEMDEAVEIEGKLPVRRLKPKYVFDSMS